jgi:DNA-binding IclR family transcriptional regulator
LEALLQARAPVSYTALEEMVDIPSASFARYLRLLVGRGYIHRNEQGLYSLGWRLAQMGRMAGDASPLQAAGADHVHQLVEETSEAAELVEFRDGNMLFLERVESPRAVGVRARPGTVFPLGPGSAIGQLAMAFGLAGDAELEPEEAQAIREEAYCDAIQNEGQVYRGAAAIIGLDGRVPGCLTLVAPAFRVGEQERARFRACLLQHAHAISGELGAPEACPQNA